MVYCSGFGHANEDAEICFEVQDRDNWSILPIKRGTVCRYLLSSFQYLGVYNRETKKLQASLLLNIPETL